MNSAHFSETTVLTDDMRVLLGDILWGTPNHGARYRLMSVDFFDHFPRLNFHTLRDAQGHLLAMRYFHAHTLSAGPAQLTAIYHSFSAVKPDRQGQGYGGQLATLSRDALIQRLGPAGGLIYAYVERDNRRNIRNLAKAGYASMGEFWTAVFAARQPRPSPHVRPAKPEDAEGIRQLFRAFYADSAFVDADETFQDSDYWVYAKDGRILAALHAKPLHWSIERLGFPGDRLILQLLSHLPVARTLFPARDLRFLKLGNPCYQTGMPEALRAVIHSALAHHGIHTAMAYIDKASPFQKELPRAGLTGWLNALTQTPVQILGRSCNIPENVQNEFKMRAKTFSPWNL